MSKPTEVMPVSGSMRIVGRPVAYYPNIAKALGNVNAAIFLCQFLYWEGKQEGEWVYKTREEIFEETALSRYEQEGARKVLKKFGILKERLKGIPATTNYHFNWSKLDEILANKLGENQHTSWGKTSQLEGGKTPDYITETTHKNTSESMSTSQKTRVDPQIKVLIDYFFETHLSECRVKPVIDGKAAKLAKTLLSVYPLEDLKEYIQTFFKISDDAFIEKGGRSFGIFYHVVQKIAVHKNEKGRWEKWLESHEGEDDNEPTRVPSTNRIPGEGAKAQAVA